MKSVAVKTDSKWGCRSKALMFLISLALAGCSANQTEPEKVDKNALYDGRSTVSFANLPVAKTAEEGVKLGDQQLRAGEYDKALYMYIQAIQLDDQYAEALHKIGQIHLDRGNTPKAMMAFEGVLAIDANHAGGNEALGVINLKANRYNNAFQHFTRAVQSDQLRLNPEQSADASKTSPAESGKKSDKESDKPAVSGRPPVDPLSPVHAYNGLGVIADLKGDHAIAQDYYNKALMIKPNSPITLNNKGYSYYLSKQWKKAEIAYKRALKMDVKSLQSWRNLGLLYARQENYLAALSAFEQVMDSANAHNDLGYICMLEGKYEKAEYYFEKAMSLSPTYYEKAYENMKMVQRLRDSSVSQR